jgi:hypothetical protein
LTSLLQPSAIKIQTKTNILCIHRRSLIYSFKTSYTLLSDKTLKPRYPSYESLWRKGRKCTFLNCTHMHGKYTILTLVWIIFNVRNRLFVCLFAAQDRTKYLQHNLPLIANEFIEDHDPEWRDLDYSAGMNSQNPGAGVNVMTSIFSDFCQLSSKRPFFSVLIQFHTRMWNFVLCTYTWGAKPTLACQGLGIFVNPGGGVYVLT